MSEVLPPVPFDPELEVFLNAMPNTGQGFTLEDVPAMRELTSHITPDEALEADGFTVEHRAAPGPQGAPEVPLVIVRPAELTGPLPVIYSIHGGGMISGSHRQALDVMATEWGRELGCAIVSVDYRLAPENPHPAPVEDCYAGLRWVAEQDGFDPERIVITGGSAGGGLAAAVALMCRDFGGPALLGQLLQCPMLDDRNDTPSARQMRGRGIWDQQNNEVGWTALLGESRGGDDVSPYAAPARAEDLSGLPPTFIDVGSAETFRDEDVAYATRIWQAGGIAELHVWPGGFHGFRMFPGARLSQESAEARTNWLRRLLSR
ncbi:alpha/beta hydrolase [Saccharopolyspora sp. TS4A08]|uniref:Alpha/beta hydrolase n=1 Tax=Saccharopolyspora ipomoeae TaxID=3042027 RepID=A0ABT6PMZ3_9PSEU|nr:alpha/beta hydrolase [Saccharopolyspora sp. TS4A08]MDI2029345.1 alpha/beta hydrolase [Saccharopolyspora sp. TS4A08]